VSDVNQSFSGDNRERWTEILLLVGHDLIFFPCSRWPDVSLALLTKM
jgi:hypothetical protein